jgi:hypothetical protein
MTPAENPITVADTRAGRLWIRTGYAVLFVALAAAFVVSIDAWGQTSSFSLLGCVVVMWVGSGLIAFGRKLRGELAPGAFRVSKGLLSLPFGLVLAYFGPAIEHFGVWWGLLLPHVTFDLVSAIGLPHWPALVLTLIVAPFELFITAAISQMLVIAPLSAVLGSDHPIVESVRDMVGGVGVTHDEPGRHETTAWAGESMLR